MAVVLTQPSNLKELRCNKMVFYVKAFDKWFEPVEMVDIINRQNDALNNMITANTILTNDLKTSEDDNDTLRGELAQKNAELVNFQTSLRCARSRVARLNDVIENTFKRIDAISDDLKGGV